MNDLVSIIIPVYNSVKSIDKCLESVCNQNYTNLEIIIVDDGSTDGSEKKCDEWRKKDNRIKVIHKENGGVSSARNRALDIANGKYIMFLDNDDQYLAETVGTAIELFEDNTELVSFSYNIVFFDKVSYAIFPSAYYSNSTAEQKFSFILESFFKYKLGWNVWNNCFLKQTIDKNHIRFAETGCIAEDQLFCLMYISLCTSITITNKSLYNYVQSEDSISERTKKNHKLNLQKKNRLAMEALKQFQSHNNTTIFVDSFPLIYYLFIESILQKEENDPSNRGIDLRRAMLGNIVQKEEQDFLFDNLSRLSDYESFLKKCFGFFRAKEKLGRAKWLLTGHSFWYTILVKFRKRLMKR